MKCVRPNWIAQNEGFTLLEITFAAGILAMALSLLFGSLITILVVAQLNEDKALAKTHLASVLEQVRGLTVEELMEYEPPQLDRPGVRRAISLVCFDTEGQTIELPLVGDAEQPELPNPLEIMATLLWRNEKGHVFEASSTISVAH